MRAASGACAGDCVSPGPASGLAALAAVAIVASVLAVRAGRRGRHTPRRAPLVAAGCWTAVAVLGAVLLAAGFRHYGGRIDNGPDGSSYRCAAWWEEATAATDSLTDDLGRPGECRRLARGAVTPALEDAGIAAVAGGALVVLVLDRRRRRAIGELERLTG